MLFRSLGCRSSAPHAGKGKESRAVLAQRRETIEDMFPKAVMAATSTDRTRSSAAMECSAHRRPAEHGTGESEEEEDRKEDGDCQVDPGPTCQ